MNKLKEYKRFYYLGLIVATIALFFPLLWYLHHYSPCSCYHKDRRVITQIIKEYPSKTRILLIIYIL